MAHPGFFTKYSETKHWLDENWNGECGSYQINPYTLMVDVRGSVSLISSDFIYIPIQFRNIKGNFNIANNSNLLSLKGCPVNINGSFICGRLQSITTLEYAPRYIGWMIHISNCNSLITYAHNSKKKNNHHSNLSWKNIELHQHFSGNGSINDSSEEKALRYIKYLKTCDHKEMQKSIYWLNEFDNQTYEEIIPYMVEFSLRVNLDIEISDDVRKIAEKELTYNHRM